MCALRVVRRYWLGGWGYHDYLTLLYDSARELEYRRLVGVGSIESLSHPTNKADSAKYTASLDCQNIFL